MKALEAFLAPSWILFAGSLPNCLIAGSFVIALAPAWSNSGISIVLSGQLPAIICNFGNSILVFAIHSV